MFFSKFPLLQYKDNVLTDLTKRVAFARAIKDDIQILEEYVVKDGELPEHLANDFYGDPSFHWIIFLMNDIVDPYFGWPLTNEQLRKYVTQKYGAGFENALHHHEKDGVIVGSTTIGATPVTNFEYEDRENEAKRKVKIIRPEFQRKVIEEFENKIKN